MDVVLCVSHNDMAVCKLMEESVIIGLPSHYSICPFQLMYQMKNFWLKASVLYEQLLCSVPYGTLCLIHNGILKLVSAIFFIKVLFFTT